MKQFIEIITFIVLCSMIEHIPVSQSASLKQFDPDNEALINEYFSSEKVDQAAEHCLRLFGSKKHASTYSDNNNNLDTSTLSYAARKLKWRHCILKELDRINHGLYTWNIGSFVKPNEDINTEE
ncbi:hypothetical protein EWB00_005029 [Schistosoma japonicum]|uniref:Uncharacterized protein n=1 Tax=Schistosoma japonicum TaxID=6182 RepID=A0A4Z2D386_SCHJA|nr:hypothetical protein KSF78_0001823 [Schistosoma japonicum]TNN10909.1 hypothetical protein EWB00_005029 [Schistosoma japonicum]